MRIWAVMLLAIATCAAAQDPMPIVRATVEPETVNVGEPVEITVTVLVPTWFTKPTVYPSMELANAVTRRPPDASYSTRERVGRESWSGIVRSYQVYPLIAADFVFADQTLTVTFSDPETRAPTQLELPMPAVSFGATVPAGAEGLAPYVAGRSLALERSIGRTNDVNLAVGDAVTVETVARLDGLPAMFLPTLVAPPKLAGVSIYPDEPVIEDGPPATRRERWTVVFEAGGEFTLPPAELAWWNTQAKAIETSRVGAESFFVEGPPLAQAPAASGSQEDWHLDPKWAFALALAVGLAFSVPSLRRRRATARDRFEQSEAFAFGTLKKTIATHDAKAIDAQLRIWLDRLEPPGSTPTDFARASGDTEMGDLLASLHRGLYGTTERGMTWDASSWKRLERHLVTARTRYHQRETTHTDSALPSLNP